MSELISNRVGLMGWPVEHSVSPSMHNAAFELLGLLWHYSLLPTPPDEVGPTLRQLESLGYRGINVTVPHKQAVMPYLTEISDAARTIGAVNTIVVQEGRLQGHNTDAEGFLASLRQGGFEPVNKRALVLGAGGATRAVVYALARVGCATSLYNRTTSRAEALSQEMGKSGIRVSVLHSLEEFERDQIDLLVNATSVGMWPDVDASPWPDALPISTAWTVYDLVYNPIETQLLARARAVGATALGGLSMLVQQGALAFELWTGQAPSIEAMHTAAKRALGIESLSPRLDESRG